MPHDRQLEKAIIAELRDPGSVLGARVVVTAVTGDAGLIRQVGRFADKYLTEPLAAAVPDVGQVTDDVDAEPAVEHDSRPLLAARRAMSAAYADYEAVSTDITRSALTATLVHGLLTMTGEIDWRQSARAVHRNEVGFAGQEPTANICYDILQMLPRCLLSISRASH